MRFKQYGPVNIAIESPETDAVFAHFEGCVYQTRETGATGWDDESGQPYPETAWFKIRQDDAPVTVDLDSPAEPDTARLLDAAAELASFEFERFQAADAQMGDPYP